MKFLKSILKDKTLDETIKDIWERFPISIVIMLIWVGVLFYLLHFVSYNNESSTIMRSLFALIMWFFTSIWVYLIFENNAVLKKYSIWKHLAPLILTLLFYYWLSPQVESFESIIFFLLWLTGIVSSLFFSPYIWKIHWADYEETSYYAYFYRISTIFLISFILWWALAILWNIAIATVFTLFDLDGIISSKLFWDWMIVSLALITPLFALSQIPNKKDISSGKFIENNFFSFLIKFIAIPFISCYFLILYAYSLKVLLSFGNWPKWEVSWMVIGFSTFAYVIYIFSQPFAKKNTTIAKIRQALPYVVFPQLFMLFYAIYLRIYQYDVTINRYFVVVFGIWLLGISLYYILSREKKLLLIPASLTLMSILISIGPWSVYNLPESRQLLRLENNLISANILQNGIIIPLEDHDNISQELSKEIYGGIDYLCDFNNCDSIKERFPKIYADFKKEHKEDFEKQKSENLQSYKADSNYNWYIEKFEDIKYEKPRSWEIVEEITEKIKVKNYFQAKINQEHIFISLDYNKSFFPIDIENYSKIYEIQGETNNEDSAYLNMQSQTLDLPDGTRYDISSIIDKLIALHNTPGQKNPIQDPNLLKFELEWARIYIRNVNLENPQFTWEKNDYPYHWAQWYILIP